MIFTPIYIQLLITIEMFWESFNLSTDLYSLKTFKRVLIKYE